jgi:hypothetical protein
MTWIVEFVLAAIQMHMSFWTTGEKAKAGRKRPAGQKVTQLSTETESSNVTREGPAGHVGWGPDSAEAVMGRGLSTAESGYNAYHAVLGDFLDIMRGTCAQYNDPWTFAFLCWDFTGLNRRDVAAMEMVCGLTGAAATAAARWGDGMQELPRVK